ncbi:unnamed protein product [Paramecium sonneborni]|uniref:Palmitoyltransferase n=1 Tax=Paramecium sonneborni TaxID=65129 RepID=A0A8S1K0D1_9CILI|nr:unnamed protein product [Paramecium sonneborni]
MRIQHFENSLLIGKLWIGSISDAAIILFVLGSYAMLQYYFIYFFSADYYLSNSLFNWICIVLFLFNFLCGTFTEPGVVRRLQPNDDESSISIKSFDIGRSVEIGEYFQERFCSKCKVIRPPKTSHCYNCNNCVKMYDHHCTFMSNCIGQRNYKYFIGWIYTLNIQCIIWYCVLLQHTFEKFNMTEALDKLYKSQILQSATLGLLLSFCCSCTFFLRGCCQKMINMTLIICFSICLYIGYNFNKIYYENYFCSLIFIIVTLPGALTALAVAIRQSYHLAIGVNQKEWSVLARQINQKHESQNHIELAETQNTQQNRASQDQDQGNQLENESFDDKQLRQKIIEEIEDNPQLKGHLSEEKIEYIFQQRRNYYLRQKQIIDANLQVQAYKQNASLKNYFINLIKIISEKQCQSELY